MSKLLSIIIPVYKVEPYINKCLDSLLLYKTDESGKQVLNRERMELMDILIINDGTPDRSAEMSREYVARYPEYFRQIDKENGGHGSVWNMGVMEAKGKYIKFLDSDDWFENLDLLIDKLNETDADIVLTHTLDHCENNELWLHKVDGIEYGKVYDMETYDWMHNKINLNCFLHHCSTFKRELLLPYIPLFLEKQPYDDSVLPMALIYAGKSMVAYDFTVYHYLMDRPGQTISADVIRKNMSAQMRANQHTLVFLQNHIDTNMTKKTQFLNTRVRRLYQSYYIPIVELSYRENKIRSEIWDTWVRIQKCHPMTPLMMLYKCMPYKIYRLFCKMILRK